MPVLAGIGKRIDAVRVANNLSQAEMAKALGIDKSTMSRWIKGELSPTVIGVAKIAEIYKVSADYLLGIQDTKPICFLDGLTDQQIDIINLLIKEFKGKK